MSDATAIPPRSGLPVGRKDEAGHEDHLARVVSDSGAEGENIHLGHGEMNLNALTLTKDRLSSFHDPPPTGKTPTALHRSGLEHHQDRQRDEDHQVHDSCHEAQPASQDEQGIPDTSRALPVGSGEQGGIEGMTRAHWNIAHAVLQEMKQEELEKLAKLEAGIEVLKKEEEILRRQAFAVEAYNEIERACA